MVTKKSLPCLDSSCHPHLFLMASGDHGAPSCVTPGVPTLFPASLCGAAGSGSSSCESERYQRGPKPGWAVSEVTGGRPVLCKYRCCNMAGLNGPVRPSIIAGEQKPPWEHGGPAARGTQTQAACALLINCLFSFCLSRFGAPRREQLSVLSMQPLPQPSPHHFSPSFSSLLPLALKKMGGVRKKKSPQFTLRLLSLTSKAPHHCLGSAGSGPENVITAGHSVGQHRAPCSER